MHIEFIDLIKNIFIGPLQILFELIYSFARFILKSPGFSIAALSLLINLLVLPLYKRADAMQEEARLVEEKLHNGVAHIKKAFSGDEKMMILQTYYRQNNYKPTDALKGSVSLLLQIPFFMAAYNFLSTLTSLQGEDFGPIRDLGAPDGLLVIGGVAINVLPVIMTLVNFISSAIYLKGFPTKTKVQLYGMALFFLVFLYTSPSGLVFYWTLNNVFSLAKTIYYKLNNRQKFLQIGISLAGIALIAVAFTRYKNVDVSKYTLLGFGIAMQSALILPALVAKLRARKKSTAEATPNKKLFVAGSVFLTILVGSLVSTALVSSSPQEFVDITFFHHPLWHILSTLCIATGLFLVWFRVFYWLATPGGKVIFERVVWILSGVMLINYMFFGTKLGIISASLEYEMGLVFKPEEKIINLFVVIAAVLLLWFIAKKWSKVATSILAIAIVAIGGMSVVNVFTIAKSVSSISTVNTEGMPGFQLSKKGQNVVVILLDRGMNEFVPAVFEEKPELKEKFNGFVHYSNTVSFGAHTNFGTPPVYGGYEYTPVEMNKRDGETLKDKHNEALLMMPVLFNQNGYNVTTIDPPYANYSNYTDLTLFREEYPEINAQVARGKFSNETLKLRTIESNYRNFFCYSLMKCLPLYLQRSMYNEGGYHNDYRQQMRYNMSTAEGTPGLYMESFAVLENLTTMSSIGDDASNNFAFIYNDTPHQPVLLQAPDYTASEKVDNTKYDAEHTDRFAAGTKPLDINNVTQMATYHVNVSSLMEIGKWLDYLKENGVYDNTKIIIASDHAYPLDLYPELDLSKNTDDYHFTAEYYYPMLMVKDFNATEEFKECKDFMTHADVPTLATDGAIENPVNPFTGKPINSNEKLAHDQFLIISVEWDVEENNGNTFFADEWVKVTPGDTKDINNWELLDEPVVLKDHKFPD